MIDDAQFKGLSGCEAKLSDDMTHDMSSEDIWESIREEVNISLPKRSYIPPPERSEGEN